MKIFLFFIFFKEISGLNFLIKFPTRERPEKFFAQLELYQKFSSEKHSILFLVSIDEDDSSMNNKSVLEKLKAEPNLKFYIDKRTNKIGAINRDLEKHPDFDILLLASDDMTPVEKNYDEIIFQAFNKFFPDLDGTVQFNDGRTKEILNTFPIMGKKYFNRFCYIYHPDYQSIKCDDEYTLVSQLLNKVQYFDQVLFRHDHANYTHAEDSLFRFNETNEKHHHDNLVFNERKKNRFDLDQQTNYINSSLDGQKIKNEVWLSILIPSLPSRKISFERLYKTLGQQIERCNLSTKVEIVYFLDEKIYSVGYKRNQLIKKSRGKYICFIDDDDSIDENYIRLIFNALQKKPDCVGIKGVITFKGESPIVFSQSLENKGHAKKENSYLWPIRHLNPIKREIAERFEFPEKNDGEDTTWCLKLNRSKLLKTEVKIDKPIYFYNFDLEKSETR